VSLLRGEKLAQRRPLAHGRRMPRILSLLVAALIVAGCGASGPNQRAIPALTNPLLVGMDAEAARNYAEAFVAVDGYEGSTLWNVAGGERTQEGSESGVVVIDPACGLRYASALMNELNSGSPILASAKSDGSGVSGLYHETRQEALIFIEGRALPGGSPSAVSGCDERQWADRVPGYIVARLRVIEGKIGEDGARSGGTWVIEGYAASGAAVSIEVTAGLPSISTTGRPPTQVVAPDRLGRFRITETNDDRVLNFATLGGGDGRRIHWFRLRDIAPEWERIADGSNCAAPFWAFWGHTLETSGDGSVIGGTGIDGEACRTAASIPIDTTIGFDANSVGPGLWLDAYAQMGIDPVTSDTPRDPKRIVSADGNASFKIKWTDVNKEIAILATSANMGCTRRSLNPATTGRDSYWQVDSTYNVRDPEGNLRAATTAEEKLCRARAAAGDGAVDAILTSVDPQAIEAAWAEERRYRLWCGVAVYNTVTPLTGGWYEWEFKKFKGAKDYTPTTIAEDGLPAYSTGDSSTDAEIKSISTERQGFFFLIDGTEKDSAYSFTRQPVIDWLSSNGRTIDDCADLLFRHRAFAADNASIEMKLAALEAKNSIPASMRDVGGAVASDVFGVVADTSTIARDHVLGRLGLISGKAAPFSALSGQSGFVGSPSADAYAITSGAVDSITLSPSYIYSEVVDATGACEAFRDGSFIIGDLRDGYCPGSTTGAENPESARLKVMSFSTAPEALPGGTRLGYRQAPLTKITITVTDSIGGGANTSVYRSDWLPTRLVNRESPGSFDVNAGSDILSDPIGTITRGIEDWLYGIYRSTAGSWVAGLAGGAAGTLIAVPAMEVYSVRFVAPDGTPIYRLSEAVVDGEDPNPDVRASEAAALEFIFGDGTRSEAETRNRALGNPEATDERERLGAGWTELKYECTAQARAGTLGEPPGATDGSVVDFRSLIAVSGGGDFSTAACYQLNPIRVAYDLVRAFGLFIAIAALCFYVIRRQMGIDTGVRPIAYAVRWAGAITVIFGIDIVARVLGNIVGEAIVLTNLLGTQISGGAPYSHLWLFTSYLSTVQPGEGNIIVLLVMAIPSLIGLIFAFLVNAVRFGLTVVMMIIAPIWVVAILFGRSSRAFYGAISFLLRLYLIAILSIIFLLLLFAARQLIGLEGEASGNILSAVLNIVSLIAIAVVPWKLSSLIGQTVIEPLVGTLRGAIDRANNIAAEDVMSALTGKKKSGNTQTEKIDAKRIADGMNGEASKRANAESTAKATGESAEAGSDAQEPAPKKSLTERLSSIATGITSAAARAKEIAADPAGALKDGYAKSKEVAASLPERITSAASAAAGRMSDTAKTRLEQARSAGMARLNAAPSAASSRFATILSAARGEAPVLNATAHGRAIALAAGATGTTSGSARDSVFTQLDAGASGSDDVRVAPVVPDPQAYTGEQGTLFGPDLPAPVIVPETTAMPVVEAIPAPPLAPGVAPLPFVPAQVVGAQLVGSQVVFFSTPTVFSPITTGVRLGSTPMDTTSATQRVAVGGQSLRGATSDGDFALRAGEMIATAAAAGSPEIAAAAAREVAAAAFASGRGAGFAAAIGAADASAAGIEAAAIATISRANGALRAAGGALMGGVDGSRAGAYAGLTAAAAAIAAVAHEPGMQIVSTSIDNRRKQEIRSITSGVRPVAVGARTASRGANASLGRFADHQARRGTDPSTAANADALRRVTKGSATAVQIAAGEQEAARLEREAAFSTAERKAAGLPIDGIRSSNQVMRGELAVTARAADYAAEVEARYQIAPAETALDPELLGIWLGVLADTALEDLLIVINVRAADGDPVALALSAQEYERAIAGSPAQAETARAAMMAQVRALSGVVRDAMLRWTNRLAGVRTTADALLIAEEIADGAANGDTAALLLEASGAVEDLRGAQNEGEVTLVVAMIGAMLDTAGSEGAR